MESERGVSSVQEREAEDSVPKGTGVAEGERERELQSTPKAMEVIAERVKARKRD